MLTSLQGSGRGISFDDYFKQALNLDVSKLEAIIRGQDHSMPIVAAMAAYEVKKPMATAAAGQQATQQLQQAQPTVRQEMEQEMDKSGMIPDMAMLQQQRMGPQPPVLPEQAGVGALPAPNMQGMSMAHGGIIAFDDGGEVERYAEAGWTAQPTEGFEMQTERNPFFKYIQERQAKRDFAAAGGDEQELAKIEQQLSALAPENRAARRTLEKRRDEIIQKRSKAAATLPDQTAAETARLQRQAAPAAQPEYIDVSSRGTSLAAPAATSRKAAPAPAPTPAPTPAPAPAPAGETGIAGALKVREALVSGEDKELRDKLGAYEKDVATGIEGLRKIREEGKPAGKAYEKYEAQLMKEEEAAKGKEERNLQMALVNAGLAIAGGTSQYALENIGKGALVGTKQYMDGIDKLEAAAKKRQEAVAMIENARRAEDRGDWEKKNEFESRAMEMQMGAKKNSIDALSKIYDTNKRVATDIFNNMEQNKTRMEAEREQSRSRKEVAQIGAGAQRYAADKYSERQLNPAAAVKEANDAFNDWLRSSKGQMEALKPGAAEAKKRQILIDTFNAMGIPLPPGYASAPTRGNLPPLDPSTTPDLFK